MADTPDIVQLVGELRDEIRALREEMRSRSESVQPTQDVLNRLDAMAYVRRRSHAAFSVWCKRWQVHPAYRGRYSKTALDVALKREARAR